jgi:uncharacterized membrane protein YsdA (DUF1294 family)
MLTTIIVIYAAVNLFVFLLYGLDKLKAVKNQWRIPEKTLMAAAVFGVLGAILGMLIFHHKVRKPKFAIGVPVILILESVTLYIVCSYYV